MIQSSKPRKQRHFRFNAPMHARQKFVHIHIAKELQTKLGIKARSIAVRKGDIVKLMAGKSKGKTGKVNNVDLLKAKIQIEGISRKTAKGKEILLPISPSNAYLIDINLDDKMRKEKIESLKIKK